MSVFYSNSVGYNFSHVIMILFGARAEGREWAVGGGGKGARAKGQGTRDTTLHAVIPIIRYNNIMIAARPFVFFVVGFRISHALCNMTISFSASAPSSALW